MPPDSFIHETLRKFYGEAMCPRIDYASAQTEEVPLQRGVLFLMAFWSGPAKMAFANVCRIFSEVGLPEDFAFRILDVDGLGRSLAEILSQYPVEMGGWGEAYWYRDGKIIAATSVATATDERIREILAEITVE